MKNNIFIMLHRIKKLNFLINGLSSDDDSNSYFIINIWAKGNKSLTSKLEGGNFQSIQDIIVIY